MEGISSDDETYLCGSIEWDDECGVRFLYASDSGASNDGAVEYIHNIQLFS